ncbi:MAG TPA: serine/threonine-protein kinase [Polyangiaceae bacterium]
MVPERNRVIARRFRLVAELARGNMASVWLADHLGLGVRCAVKLMAHAARVDPSGRARFELEARAVARLESRHIVRVLDYDVEDDTPFIAMELLRGEELTARIARLGRLDPATTYALVSQIAHGLSSAHAAGIVHRDLKPENVFLAETEEGEVVKILDFGIAKMVSAQEWRCGTLEGQVLGTPQYMSPEQVRGAKTIDHRSDLWSLGVVTYYCLIGRLPFDSPALGEVFAQIVADPLPVPSQVAPAGVRVPPGFDLWWARAVSRDVEGRFGSAWEMVEALGRALDEEGSEGRARDVTTPPIALSPRLAPEEPFEVPMRARWRSKLVLVAVAVAVVIGAAAVRDRAASATARSNPVAAPAGTAAESVAVLQPLAELPPIAASSADPLPRPPVAPHKSVFKGAVPRRWAPVVRAPAVRVEPHATAISSPAPSPVAPPATAPTEDVDFGI